MDDLKFSVKVDSNLDKLLQEQPDKIEKALYAMGTLGVEGAVRSISGQYTAGNKAVDTGRLRASISFITTTQEMPDGQNPPVKESKSGDKLGGSSPKNTAIIGTNVDYASYVHNGTSRTPGRPFIQEGIQQTSEKMQDQVKSILEGIL